MSRLSYLPHYPACNSVLSVAQSFLLPFTKDEFLSAVLKYSLSIFNQRVYWNKIEWESRVNFKFSSLSSCCLGANLKGADSLIKAQNFKWNKDEYSKCNLKDIDLKSQTKAYFFLSPITQQSLLPNRNISIHWNRTLLVSFTLIDGVYLAIRVVNWNQL